MLNVYFTKIQSLGETRTRQLVEVTCTRSVDCVAFLRPWAWLKVQAEGAVGPRGLRASAHLNHQWKRAQRPEACRVTRVFEQRYLLLDAT